MPKPGRKRKTSPTPIDLDSLSAEERDLFEKIVFARWRTDSCPPEQLVVAAEVAIWLVRERGATVADFDRWLGWWYRHPDSMASRNPTKPWPRNVRNTWDTCFDVALTGDATTAEQLTPAQRSAREASLRIKAELAKERANVSHTAAS